MVLAAILLLLPGPAGRLLLSVLGGATLLFLLLPVLVTAVGLLAWQALRPHLITCGVCGIKSLSRETCPACGSPLTAQTGNSPREAWKAGGIDALEAGQVTIDVEAVDVPASGDEGSRQAS